MNVTRKQKVIWIVSCKGFAVVESRSWVFPTVGSVSSY